MRSAKSNSTDALSLTNVGVRFGGISALSNVSFSVPTGQLCGLIGANGAGKTTLFKMIMGLEKPDSGDFKVGDTVQIGYVDQSHDDLVPGKNGL